MPVARTIEVDGQRWVSVADLISHLMHASESVMNICYEDSPFATKIVCDTINQTVDTLKEML